jgi:hypothetical protein
MGIVHGKHLLGDDMRTMAEFNYLHESLNFSSYTEEHV